MRPRKYLQPLTLDGIRAHMAPGRSYTAAMLACIFDGSPAAIVGLLETLQASGALRSSIAYRESRPSRRRYWLAPPTRPSLAARAELRGYDLTRFARLAMDSRR